MESRLLFSFEERVCGEIVGDYVGESWAPLLHRGRVCYGTEGCEETAEQENGSHSVRSGQPLTPLLHHGQ